MTPKEERAKGSTPAEYRRRVLAQIDGDYLLDYAVFTGALRVYVTATLNSAFENDKNETHRRLFMLALYTQEYLAYEDLAAMLDALMTHRKNPAIPIVDRLMSYRAAEINLEKTMSRFRIDGPQRLYEALGLQELVPSHWAMTYPDLNLARALKIAASFFFKDCVRNQKPDGKRAFNKLKHGLLVVPNARVYLPNKTIDAPAAFIETTLSHPDAGANPFTVFAIPQGDEHLKQRLDSIHFMQSNLRLIAGLTVVMKYPEVARKRKDADPIEIFKTPQMTDIVNFVKQTTDKLKDPWRMVSRTGADRLDSLEEPDTFSCVSPLRVSRLRASRPR